MGDLERTAERSVAIFLFGFLAFCPPFLWIFGAEAFVFRLPLLYVYLFAAWGLIIVAVAWTADLRSGPPPDQAGARRAPGPKVG